MLSASIDLVKSSLFATNKTTKPNRNTMEPTFYVPINIIDTKNKRKGVHATASIAPGTTIATANATSFVLSRSTEGKDKINLDMQLLMLSRDILQSHPHVLQDLYPRHQTNDGFTKVRQDRGQRLINVTPVAQPAESLKTSDLINAYEKVLCNAFRTSFGSFLYAGDINKFNHSCIPNCVYTISNEYPHTITIKSLTPIEPNEEMTIAYITPRNSKVDMLDAINRDYCFQCYCDSCGAIFDALNGESGTKQFKPVPIRPTEVKALRDHFTSSCWWCGMEPSSSTPMNSSSKSSSEQQSITNQSDNKSTCTNTSTTNNTNTSNTGLFICTSCRQIRYCSRECQKADWKACHKGLCSRIREEC